MFDLNQIAKELAALEGLPMDEVFEDSPFQEDSFGTSAAGSFAGCGGGGTSLGIRNAGMGSNGSSGSRGGGDDYGMGMGGNRGSGGSGWDGGGVRNFSQQDRHDSDRGGGGGSGHGGGFDGVYCGGNSGRDNGSSGGGNGDGGSFNGGGMRGDRLERSGGGGGSNFGGGLEWSSGGGGAPRDYNSFGVDGDFQYPEQEPLQLPDCSSVVDKELDAKMAALTNVVEKWRKVHKESKLVYHINASLFKNKQFRTHQLEIINAALAGEDVFVLMPTGGGKSLCYQCCALVRPGITVVISPLVSLMQDQVYNLAISNVGAICLNASSTADELQNAYRCFQAKDGDKAPAQIVYITPEKYAKSGRIRSEMKKCRSAGMLSRVVIDEAHCVSEWGHDFRPDYKMLGSLKTELDNVPIMALTATATSRVRKDIRQILHIPNSYIFVQSFNRPNLMYEVRIKKKAYQEDVIKFIKEKYKGETGIVYCLSKHRCEDMAESLSKEGINARPYHAGLDDDVRRRNQDDWSNDKIHVICATIAFGMGINKPDVRFVVHDSLPKSMEGYYQESGRAGRDGKLSHCILYYTYRDKTTHDKMAEEDLKDKKQRMRGADLLEAETQRINLRHNLNSMVSYCESTNDCRRQLQMAYFGEHFQVARCKNTCDNCWSGKTGSAEEVDISTEAEAFVNIVEHFHQMDQIKSITFMTKLFRGSQAKECHGYGDIKGFGAGKKMKETDAERLYRLLAQKEIVKETSENNTSSVYGGTMTTLSPGPNRHLLRTEGLQMAFEILPDKAVKGKKVKEPKETKSKNKPDQKPSTAKERKAANKKFDKYEHIDSDSDGVMDLTDDKGCETQRDLPGKLDLVGNDFISADQQAFLHKELLGVRDKMLANEKQKDLSYTPHPPPLPVHFLSGAEAAMRAARH